jgi:hypothetical protein
VVKRTSVFFGDQSITKRDKHMAIQLWQFNGKTGKYIKSFPSARAASRAVNSDSSNILVASRRGYRSGGFYWRIAEGKKPKQVPTKQIRQDAKSIRVYDWLKTKNKRGKLKATYSSMDSAAKALNVTITTIRKCCREKDYVIQHKYDCEFVNPKDNETRTVFYNNKPKPVYAYSLNGKLVKEFKSTGEASRVTGIAKSDIMKCARKEAKRAKNYIWRYQKRPKIKGLK